MTDNDRAEVDGGMAKTHGAVLTRSDTTVENTIRQAAAVARLEYRLSIRNRWAFALTILYGLLTGVIVTFGTSKFGPVQVDAVVVSLASLATYLVPLAALVYAFDAVVGAEETGWLDMVFALPVPRSRIVFGTFLGRAAILGGATAIGFGLGGFLLSIRAGPVSWTLYATVVLGGVVLGLSFLAIGVLVSTVVTEKTHALGLALLVWVWFVFGHDLAALGLVAWFDLPSNVLTVLVLSNPVDIFRVLVLSGIDSTGGGMAAVVARTNLSPSLLVAAAITWIVAPVMVASRAIRRRSI